MKLGITDSRRTACVTACSLQLVKLMLDCMQ